MRKYPCWDAKGPVRDLFMSEIAGKIKTCLEQCLPESNSFVGFSLFMVGKLPEKTKPTIMIVSDDKRRRKDAFQVVKSKNILAVYPGFELGHCAVAAEFEDLRQLGSDTTSSSSEEPPDDVDDGYIQHRDDGDEPGAEIMSLLSAEACAFETPNGTKPTRLYFNTPRNPHSHNSASATCGGLFRYQDEIYALTMAHAIHPIRRAVMGPAPRSDSSSESDDFEITGMEDWDEDDEEGDTKTLTAITSPGSRTPSELSDSEDSLLKRNDSRLSSEISIQTRFATAPSIIYEENCTVDDYEDDEDIPEICERVGSVVSVDQVLEIAVIKTTLNTSTTGLFTLPIKGFLVVDDPTQRSVTVRTTHHAEIKGQRSPTPFYTRLPGTDNFLELYSVQLRTPLRPGDSGSWAFNDKGEIAGFVVAGNPQTGSCLLLPARQVLQSMESLLSNRARPVGLETTNWPASMLSLATGTHTTAFRDERDEDAMTVASSVPPPSIFSQRMDRGTPSTTTTSYGRRPGASLARESLYRDDAASASSFVSKGDFLEDQVGRLRRELERAWEIIQEKDKHLQHIITGNLHNVLRTPAKYTALPQSGVDYSLPFSPIQDSSQDLGQSSPLEQSHSPNAMILELPRAAKPETLAASDNFPTASVVQSVKDSLEAWKTEVNDTMEEQKTMLQAQVAANEALNKENKELKQGIGQARMQIWNMTAGQGSAVNRKELLKIAGSLSRILHSNGDGPEPAPGPSKVQKEPEQNETMPMDIPPSSSFEQTQRWPTAFNESRLFQAHTFSPANSFPFLRPRQGKSKQLVDTPALMNRPPDPIERPSESMERPGERRILKPKSRLTSPLLSSRSLRGSLSDVGRGINTVLEEDEGKYD